ncbi:MAG TPA: hypothetical protein ENF52_03340 [Chloroflexi bacterium]|nr:hypothetical protein [Chloroflexota bacterium]
MRKSAPALVYLIIIGVIGLVSMLLYSCLASVAGESSVGRFIGDPGDTETGGGICPPGAATVIRVCSTCEITSVQAGIDCADVGDVIQIAEGIYRERLVITKGLTLEGGWNAAFSWRDIEAARTVVDGHGSGPVVTLSAMAPVTIDGFWIMGGNSPQGGGILVTGTRSVIHNNVISGNVATNGRGGGVCVTGNGAAVLLDANVLTHNVAHVGGGLFVERGAVLTATNNLIVGNISEQGGGICLYRSGGGGVVNNTLIYNYPAAICASGDIPIVNNIIVSHEVGISLTRAAGTSWVLPTHNLFYSNTYDYAGDLTAVLPTTGVVANPLFTDGYHLSALSPAIDKGIDMAAPSHDIDGDRRPIGRVDIGADEAGTVLYMPGTTREVLPWGHKCRFGVGIWPSKNVITQTGAAQDLGVCWTRISIHWDKIEPVRTEPRTYHWEDTDRQVLSVTEAGIGVIGLLTANPSWAAAYPGGPVTDTQDVLDFLAAAAERYDGDGFLDAPGSPIIQVWEMYNEPDNQVLYYAQKRGWGYWGNHGDEYVQFLAQARSALKSANPYALVAFGGLAREKIPGDVFDLDFAAVAFAYVQEHPGDYFDIFNFHYFPVFATMYEDWGAGIIGKATYFRELMSLYEVNWPIIVTESGYWSDSDSGYEGQARYVPQLYSRGATADVDVVMWLLLFDLPVHDVDRGLSNVNGIPKPSYNAYRVAVDKLSAARFEGSLSPSELSTESAEGYAFARDDGSHLYVVWATEPQVIGTLRVAGESALVSDKVSCSFPMSPTIPCFEPYVVTDGDDGKEDGVTEITFTDNPIYVEVWP